MPYRFDVRYQITVVEAGKVVDKLRATPFEKHILTLSPSSTPSRLSGKSTLGSSTFLDFGLPVLRQLAGAADQSERLKE
jgi:hypothetical protein